MLLRTDREGMNSWYNVAYRGDVNVMRAICEFSKARLTTEEIKNEMLLRTDRAGRNAWYNAAYRGNVNVKREIRELAKERLTKLN